MSNSPSITVAAKVVGQKRSLFTDWHIPIPPDKSSSGSFTLRDLISLIVVKEVEAFKQRQEARKLDQIFTAEQIQEGAVRGKITPEERDLQQVVDESASVTTSLQAFEDWLYFVFIDDVQQETLDQTVYIGKDSQVLFVRLVALAGG
jgi:hypothetical protein